MVKSGEEIEISKISLGVSSVRIRTTSYTNGHKSVFLARNRFFVIEVFTLNGNEIQNSASFYIALQMISMPAVAHPIQANFKYHFA